MQDRLLVRQFRHLLGLSSDAALNEYLDKLRAKDEAQLAGGLQALLHDSEKNDLAAELQLRNLEVKCEELSSANEQLKAEAAHQKVALMLLQSTLQRLTHSGDDRE